MKFFDSIFAIFKSPLGIGFATMQWLVILFAYLGDKPEPSGFHKSTTYLLYYLANLNFIALRVAELITYIFASIAKVEELSVFLSAAIFFITLQWILVGKIIELFVESTKEKPVNLFK